MFLVADGLFRGPCTPRRNLNLDVHSHFVDLYFILLLPRFSMSHNTSVDHSHYRLFQSHMRLETTRRASSVRRGRLAYEQCAGPLTTTTHTHRHPVLPSTNHSHTHWRSFFLSHHHLASFDAGSHPAHTRFIRSRAVRSKQHVLEVSLHTHTQGQQNEIKEICLFVSSMLSSECMFIITDTRTGIHLHSILISNLFRTHSYRTKIYCNLVYTPSFLSLGLNPSRSRDDYFGHVFPSFFLPCVKARRYGDWFNVVDFSWCFNYVLSFTFFLCALYMYLVSATLIRTK